MLRRVDNKTVEGSGFQIVVRNIHTVTYNERSREAAVEIEGGLEDGNVTWLVYIKTLSSWRLHGAEQDMTDDEQTIVLERISSALELLNMPHRLV